MILNRYFVLFFMNSSGIKQVNVTAYNQGLAKWIGRLCNPTMRLIDMYEIEGNFV